MRDVKEKKIVERHTALVRKRHPVFGWLFCWISLSLSLSSELAII